MKMMPLAWELARRTTIKCVGVRRTKTVNRLARRLCIACTEAALCRRLTKG
jgi:hypothetical protein